MSRASLGIALMIVAALVVSIVATAGPAAAADKCSEQVAKCVAGCGSRCGDSEFCTDICDTKCWSTFEMCAAAQDALHPKPGRSAPTNAPPTDPTGTPLKGGLKPITGGGIKDPGSGGGSSTKPIRGLEPINSGSTQQSGDGSGSGTTTIYRTHTSHGKH
jgi:hypothetical protein